MYRINLDHGLGACGPRSTGEGGLTSLNHIQLKSVPQCALASSPAAPTSRALFFVKEQTAGGEMSSSQLGPGVLALLLAISVARDAARRPPRPRLAPTGASQH